jgi:hypothetical protein
MPTSTLKTGTPEYLSRVREIIRPALRQRIKLTTTTGRPVTLQSLPRLIAGRKSINMIGEGGELIAITLPDGERPDTKRPREGLPAFCQMRFDGERSNFWLLPEGDWRSNNNDYLPAVLELDAHILNAQYDSFDRLARLDGVRVPRLFRKLDVQKVESGSK